MALIELVDFNDLLLAAKAEKAGAKAKTTRRGRAGKKADAPVAAAKVAAPVVAAPVAEVTETVEEVANDEVVDNTPACKENW